ncbi:hypothetical protein [Spiroplasma ixodetis]|uniref:Ribbon-helix-helix protein CopG domain-containing protein n=1 Tax=Spiroplasma ixodetis TaxID=2141 RepID=A0ABN6T622_9MOLU|nr:hypothetical protein [Spiroplasma ixodetis]BDT04555.1 hypothetical protein SHM_22010 [Spiroplasma ixodetis]
MEKKVNLFKDSKLKDIDNLTNNLIGNNEHIKQENVYNKINIVPKNKSIRRIPLNLTILPNKINKLKNIAKQNNLSVSALLEQIIDQL